MLIMKHSQPSTKPGRKKKQLGGVRVLVVILHECDEHSQNIAMESCETTATAASLCKVLHKSDVVRDLGGKEGRVTKASVA